MLLILDLVVGSIGLIDRELCSNILYTLFCDFVKGEKSEESMDFVKEKSGVLSHMRGYFTKGDTRRKEMGDSQQLSEKARKLHDAHKLGDNQKTWFQNEDDDLPVALNLPSYYKENEAQLEYTTSPQVAYNVNSSCFENLQVQQTIYNPDCSYTGGGDYFNPAEMQYFEEDSEPEQSFFSSPFGYIYENFIDFVETTIVQYVCQRTQPSPLRLAAEILAGSRLNPNATEFTPLRKGVEIVDEKESTELSSQRNEDSLHEESREEPQPPFCKLVQCITATRNISICDDSYLNVSKRNSFNEEEDLDEESDGDDFDESDWDSDEQSSGQCVELDPSEFEDLFPCPLLLSNLNTCQSKASNLNTSKMCQIDKGSIEEELTKSSLNIVDQINKEYFKDDEILSECLKICSGKHVTFCDDIEILDEPEDLAEDLQNARVSDFQARQADKERMELLLGPILTKVHRDKIFNKIYNTV